MPQPLSPAEIDAALASLPDWSRVGGDGGDAPLAIARELSCASFADAIALVVRIGFLAEAADHHPDLDVRWRTIRVRLTSHDAAGVTPRDLGLARQIDEAAP